MNVQLWIGFGFGGLFFIFLMVAFFANKNMTQGQHLILRIMTSFCAGLAAGLISGDASIQISQNLPGGRLTGGFTAGIAVLLTVLLLFPKYPKPKGLPGHAVNFTFPQDWTFREGVQGLAINDKATATFEGFTSEELDAPIQPRELKADSMSKALAAVRRLTVKAGAVRDYEVHDDGSTYHLKIK
jgi:hypothetical protein